MNKVTNGACLICFVTGYCIGQLVVYGYLLWKGREDESTRSNDNSRQV